MGDAEREMSDFDSNPFADPDLNNPFKDPSVTQVTRNVPPGLDEYNPFSDSRTPPPGNVTMPDVPSTQPAMTKPTEEHPAYTQVAKEHALAHAELLKRQEELEREAAESDLENEKCKTSVNMAEKTIGHLFLTISLWALVFIRIFLQISL